ncbi:hypothetical protein [Priestia megaterium]|uniref:hypothetical protein n=1 Tax=Priestia megaterium TaxID=1404 RepID=UPI00112AF498|nr:hypothetical protein [Priestia megaterium]TPF18002.1 hypothetical protein CBE78_01895 [Priestia megaterium]TPF22109.1 hypothetical protein CBE79_04400 [Priestia megaterium]
MFNNAIIRNLLLLLLLVTTCFTYALTEYNINKMKTDNYETFSGDVKPLSVKTNCFEGMKADQECSEDTLLSQKDNETIEQRTETIGFWDDINTICFYLSVILAVMLTYSLWIGSKDNETKRGDYNVLH